MIEARGRGEIRAAEGQKAGSVWLAVVGWCGLPSPEEPGHSPALVLVEAQSGFLYQGGHCYLLFSCDWPLLRVP